MRKFSLVLILAALSSQSVFADDMKNKSCTTIAKACLNAGFKESGTSAKQFWRSCMKPVIMGKTVKGVKVDADTVKDCRAAKIEQMTKELKEFQAVSE